MLIGIIISIVIILLTNSNPTTSAARQSGASPELPEVQIMLLNKTQTAHVSLDDDGIVKFNGVLKIKCDDDPITRVEVSLTAIDTWGFSSITPSLITFYQSGQEPFIVSVQAPQEESCYEDGIVRIVGRWTMYPGGASGVVEPEEGVIGEIDIAQYSRYILSIDQKICDTRPGVDVDFKLGIRNLGNGNDTFFIEILNQETLHKNGFSVSLNPKKVVISEDGQGAIIVISADIPSSTSVIGQNIIEVSVNSEYSLLEGRAPRVVRFVIDISREYLYETDEFIISLLLTIIIIIICVVIIWQWRKKRGAENKESI